MSNLFEFATGSVAGRSHRLSGKNNQDAYHGLNLKGYSVAVVCDGCGSGRHSEVGAHIGARITAQAVTTRAMVADELASHTIENHATMSERAVEGKLERSASLADSPLPDFFMETVLEQARHDILICLRNLSQSMGEDLPSVISNYFLFTVVGVLLTPSSAAFFSLGDGVLVINGRQIPLGPFPDNAPPYLAYGLMPGSLHATDPCALCFQVHCVLPIHEVKSFLIGTDGVQDLVQAAERCLPGKSERVGPLHQFWRDERYFANPDIIRRRLAGISRDVLSVNASGRLHKVAGMLPDDTTLIVGRRRGTVEVQITEVPDED